MKGAWRLPGDRLLYPSEADIAAFEHILSSVRCTLCSAGYVVCPRDWSVPERTIPQHALWLCVGGDADITVDGAPYRIEQGSLLLIPAGARRRASHNPANPLRVYVVRFTARIHGVLDLPTVFPAPIAWCPHPCAMEELVQAAQRIVAELTSTKLGSTLAINGDCARLVALLWRDVAMQVGKDPYPSAAPVSAVARLAPVFRTIQARFTEQLTLAELARSLNLHPAYFSALFKEITGLPPMRYLTQYRFERARELLLTTNLPISSIAAETGYGDPFYLSRVFHKVEGMSPTEYRRSKQMTVLP
ncbi:MAG: AraC family transcriptional regulator [Chloroflexi bacterium]|nr:AraC family transcriptional regulator [Chloroflexota bacterium]